MKWFAVFPLMMIVGGVLLLNSGGGSEEQKSDVSDVATVAFQNYETAWRKLQGTKAEKLRAGEFASEKASEAWFLGQNGTALKEAFTPVLNAEFEAFGGEAWTAEKEAAFAERLVR